MEYAIKMGVGQISLCFQPVKYIFKILGLKGALNVSKYTSLPPSFMRYMQIVRSYICNIFVAHNPLQNVEHLTIFISDGL